MLGEVVSTEKTVPKIHSTAVDRRVFYPVIQHIRSPQGRIVEEKAWQSPSEESKNLLKVLNAASKGSLLRRIYAIKTRVVPVNPHLWYSNSVQFRYVF